MTPLTLGVEFRPNMSPKKVGKGENSVKVIIFVWAFKKAFWVGPDIMGELSIKNEGRSVIHLDPIGSSKVQKRSFVI